MRDTDITQLIQNAFSVREHSYSPYSQFRVGAALLCESGNIYTGANFENSSYPVGICAERSAFAAALSQGERHFAAIAVVGGNRAAVDYCMPCGMCRQFLSEFCDGEFLIIAAKSAADYRLYQLNELLPYGFNLD